MLKGFDLFFFVSKLEASSARISELELEQLGNGCRPSFQASDFQRIARLHAYSAEKMDGDTGFLESDGRF